MTTHQRGTTLFISLIVLVALSLAGVAMLRPTDTANLITGNLGFKKATLHAGDLAVQRTTAVITGVGTLPAGWTALDATDKESDQSRRNYRASMFARGVTGDDGLNMQGIPNVLANAPAPTSAGGSAGYGGARGVDNSNEIADATTGQTVRWVIDRICRAAGPVTATNCSITGSSQINEGTVNERYFGTSAGPYFRITIRVDGPRNSVTYTQVIVRDT